MPRRRMPAPIAMVLPPHVGQWTPATPRLGKLQGQRVPRSLPAGVERRTYGWEDADAGRRGEDRQGELGFDARVKPLGSEEWGREADPFDPLGLVHPDPSHYTVGATLTQFRTPPPSPREQRELLHARGTPAGDRRRRDFLAWVAANTETRFEGKGDAHALAKWISCLRGYFSLEGLTNTALQAQLAAATFRGKARHWWNAHTRQRPWACLSFPQLAELIQTELVPAADAQTAFIAWSRLTYTGRADAFLKQLDALVETFPLPPMSLMQMATAPLGRAFAAEVRNAGPVCPPHWANPIPSATGNHRQQVGDDSGPH